MSLVRIFTATMIDMVEILLPLFITLGVETGIYMILKHKDFKLFCVASLMNVVLNSLMNVGLYFLSFNRVIYLVILIISEISTVVIESFILYFVFKFDYKKILIVSVISNTLSFLVGFFINSFYNYLLDLIMCLVFILMYLIISLVVVINFIKFKISSNY